jgi:cell division protein FtsQ
MSDTMRGPVWTPVRFRPERGAAARRALPARPPRWKALAGAILRTTAAMGISTALCLGAWQGYRFAERATFFTLREVRFTGLAHATREELLQRSGLLLGTNLFHLDLAAATRAIEAHPWVASARLSRRLPGAVDVEVVEHRPAANLQLGGLYLLDDLGRVFKRAAADDGVDLPLITGMKREDWGGNRPAAQLRVYTALQLLDAWKAEGLPVSSLEEVRLDDDGGLTAVARDGGELQEIHLGARDLSLKLRRLVQVRAALQRRGERASRIDLDNQAQPDFVAAQVRE